jgi:hypothetical protein
VAPVQVGDITSSTNQVSNKKHNNVHKITKNQHVQSPIPPIRIIPTTTTITEGEDDVEEIAEIEMEEGEIESPPLHEKGPGMSVEHVNPLNDEISRLFGPGFDAAQSSMFVERLVSKI